VDNALGLVVTGGGARGAYQAGVLKRIGEIKRVQTHGNPFPIIGGASAGAINGSALAVGSDDFALATQVIARLWSELKPSDVFRCDLLSQTRTSLAWILDLSFGGIVGGGNARSLLDATPLRRYLNKHLDCDRIQDNIKRGHVYALAISATNYNSGKSYLFIQGRKGHPMWNRSRRVTLATKITVDHVCASAAIPLVFQPVSLSARSYASGQTGFSPLVSAAKISNIKWRLRTGKILPWHKSWGSFSMLCSWTTLPRTSNTWSG